MPAASAEQTSILDTRDDFMATVVWDDWRRVLVYRRQHGGRTYIRLRTWNRHRKLRKWYPSDRFFVIPIGNATALADAIRAAADGRAEEKPDWLVESEKAAEDRVIWMKDVQAPLTVIERAIKQLTERRRGRT